MTTGGSMTKAELVEEVSRVSDLTKKHSEVIVDTVFKSIIDALHRGEKIELRGFGSFRLRKREPRKGRNPKTGDKVDVPPKKVPYFKPGKELKELINREPEVASPNAAAPPDAWRSRDTFESSRLRIESRWRLETHDLTTHSYGTSLVALETGLRDGPPKAVDCIFCDAVELSDRSARDALVLVRGRALLRHPQSVSLQQRPPDGRAEPARRRRWPPPPPTNCEMMRLTRDAEIALTEAYQPQGINVGVNLGRPAGAGIVDHVHIHLVPRWNGDTNFMSVIGNVRVLPEELGETRQAPAADLRAARQRTRLTQRRRRR